MSNFWFRCEHGKTLGHCHACAKKSRMTQALAHQASAGAWQISSASVGQQRESQPEPDVTLPDNNMVCWHGNGYGECDKHWCGFTKAKRDERIRELKAQVMARQAEQDRLHQEKLAALKAERERKMREEDEKIRLVIEPFFGYKALMWNGKRFASPSAGAVWNADHTLVAVCGPHTPTTLLLWNEDPREKHPVPSKHCHCGIYGVADAHRIRSYLSGGGVIVLVKGTGRVIPAEHGFRCSHAEVIATWTLKRRLIDRPAHHQGTASIENMPTANTMAENLGHRPSN